MRHGPWLIALAVSGAGCLGPGFGIYLPVRTEAYELPDNHIPAGALEELAIDTPDGERLAAMLALHGDAVARPTAVFLHGQGGNLDDAWPWVMALWDLGYDVGAVDYRGYGKSTGEPTEDGLYTDARVFYDALAADPRVDPARLVIWGHSMGTGVASHLALEAPARALVLEAPFTSMRDMVEESSPYAVPAEWFTDAVFDTEGRIAAVDMPLVVAHGTDDLRIPYWMGVAVYDAAREPKRFVRASGATHNDVVEREGDAMVARLGEMDAGAAP